MRTRKSWYRIENAAESREADVFIYDFIGAYAVEADDLVRDLAALDVDVLNVRINSPGGDVFQGMAIHTALQRHKAKVVVHVDGLAASIAAVIAMAGEEVRMGAGTFLMIHNAAAFAFGDAREMRRMADLLDKVTGSIADVYVRRSGKTREEVLAWMADETWFSAEEAVEAGLADSVTEELALVATFRGFDLGRFHRVPEALVAAAGSPRDIHTIRDFEAFLREEGGFSRDEAKQIASRGYKAAPGPREEAGGLSEIVSALQQRGEALATPRT